MTTWCWYSADQWKEGAKGRVACRDGKIVRIALPAVSWLGGGRFEWRDRDEVRTGFASEVAQQLSLFFGGGTAPKLDASLVDFDAIDTMTPFRRRVLEACARVRRSHHVTYGELGEMIGMDRRKCGRPIGQVMMWNPFPLLIPCHRVLSSDPARENYAGGPLGVPLKKHLLRVEGLELDRLKRS